MSDLALAEPKHDPTSFFSMIVRSARLRLTVVSFCG